MPDFDIYNMTDAEEAQMQAELQAHDDADDAMCASHRCSNHPLLDLTDEGDDY